MTAAHVPVTPGQLFPLDGTCPDCHHARLAGAVVWFGDTPTQLTVCTHCGMHAWSN